MDDEEYSDLYGEAKDLAPQGELPLQELAAPGAELTTGLALTWRSRLVFALAPRARALGSRGQPGTLAFVGIGGHLDPGERWTQAVAREAQEEANCPIDFGDSSVTYLCRPDAAPQQLTYRWDEPYRPLLVWVATFNLRRGPQRLPTPVTMIAAVFRAAALTRPKPGMEVESLLLLDQEQLAGTYDGPRRLGDLMAHGAEVIGPVPPADSLLAPGGTAYFLAQWLAWQR